MAGRTSGESGDECISDRSRIQDAAACGRDETGTVPELSQSDRCRAARAQRLRLAAGRHAARTDGQRKPLRHARRHRQWRCDVHGARRRLLRSPVHPAVARHGRRRRARALHQHRRRSARRRELLPLPDCRHEIGVLSAAQHEQGRAPGLCRRRERQRHRGAPGRDRRLHQEHRRDCGRQRRRHAVPRPERPVHVDGALRRSTSSPTCTRHRSSATRRTS